MLYMPTRGPWTATPALIKVEETEQDKMSFLHARKYSKL